MSLFRSWQAKESLGILERVHARARARTHTHTHTHTHTQWLPAKRHFPARENAGQKSRDTGEDRQTQNESDTQWDRGKSHMVEHSSIKMC